MEQVDFGSCALGAFKNRDGDMGSSSRRTFTGVSNLHLDWRTNAVSPQWHHGRRHGIASMEEDQRSRELQLPEGWKPSVNEKKREIEEERQECILGEHCPVTSSLWVVDSKAMVFTVAHSERSCSFSAVQW